MTQPDLLAAAAAAAAESPRRAWSSPARDSNNSDLDAAAARVLVVFGSETGNSRCVNEAPPSTLHCVPADA